MIAERIKAEQEAELKKSRGSDLVTRTHITTNNSVPSAEVMDEEIKKKSSGMRPLYQEPFEQVVKKWLVAEAEKKKKV